MVNLISDDYLLRDYMVDNRDIFSSDAKAIPSFAPDFARTERNTVLRIVLTMVAFQLDEAALVQELQLDRISHLASGAAATDGLRERPAIQCASRVDHTTHRRDRHTDRAGDHGLDQTGSGRRGSDPLSDQPRIGAWTASLMR